ncbi:MAG: type II toxin-antitoxin system prevent-host-death family antitoxin [Pseudomonadota bacterium]
MERHEIVPDERIAPLIDAIERGDEVVFMRGGKEVAKLTPARPEARRGKPMTSEDLQRMREIRESLPGPPIDAAALVREMRDEGH